VTTMMVAFKILMFICAILSFFGSMGEKDTAKQKMQLAIFASSGVLFLLAEAVTKFIH